MRRGGLRLVWALGPLACAAAACGAPSHVRATRLVITGSAVGAEAEVLRSQVRRFEAEHPEVAVVVRPTPDAADQRHQLYAQWLAAGTGEPDVLQLDVIWAAEMAAAGWIRPVPRTLELGDVLPAALAAGTYDGTPYAVPWFVDVGMLYWRTDLLPRAPATLEELVRDAEDRSLARVPLGLVLTAARYEGLITVFLQVLGAFGGELVDARGQPAVDSPAGRRALEWLRSALARGILPVEVLGWREEPVRFAFQNGRALFMLNWPYALALMQDPRRSSVAGRFAVAPFPPAPGGHATAALGGSQLAVNAATRHPAEAWALVEFLTRPEQMLERLRVTGQLPPRLGLYDRPKVARLLPVAPAELRRVLEAARPRPVTPAYTAMSQALQVHVHRALTGQEEPAAALAAASAEMRAAQARLREAPRAGAWDGVVLAALVVAAAFVAARLVRRGAGRAVPGGSDRLAVALVSPALVVMVLVSIAPVAWTVVESLRQDDLRAPWLGHAFIGLASFREAARDPRMWAALGHTALFTVASVGLELVLGLGLALALDRSLRGRGIARVLVLLPWALPTVVAGLVWRFMFEGRTGLANGALVGLGVLHAPLAWLSEPVLAWVPLVLADVWKTTPFVALLLLAGLQGIDRTLYEAARIDGAGALGRLWHVTLPLLRPALLVALVFRSIDAVRLFDLAYVLTGGGPGTATEPLALYAYDTLLGSLRFGYGAALSLVLFAVAVVLAVVDVRLLGSREAP